MDRVSESLLKEFSTEHGISHLPEDKRFEHFASAISIGRHYSDSFDTEDVLVGTAAGIDGIAIIVNNKLITDIDGLDEVKDDQQWDVSFIFVQADRGATFDTGKMGNIGFAVEDFFKDAPTLPRTPEVEDAAAIMAKLYEESAKFKPANPICRIYYATTGTWTNDPNLEGRRQAIIADLNGTNLFREVTFTPLGANEVQRLYRQRKNAVQSEFLFEQRLTIPEIDGVTQAYLGYLPFPELRKILVDEAGEIMGGLFYSNPRDWQEYNDVNDEIRNTLQSDAKSQFVLKNNGITIIAREIRPTGNKFVIEDYQIVNGCQTSHVLFGNADKADKSVAVPVRLIGTQDESVINSIIRGTNRQTPVTEEQFFALEEFPKQLEQYFLAFPPAQRLYFERRSRQYDRTPNVERTRIITQSNAIKAFAAMFLDEAHRTTRNFSAVKSKVGKDIFGKGHKKEPYYAASLAYYKLDYMLRNSKLDRKFKPARFHILLAMRLIGNKSHPPAMNSKEIDAYCKTLIDRLAGEESEAFITKAAEIVEHVANGNFDRDSIRTEPMTSKVISACQGVSA